ncbi:putative Ig domain-containing protein [Candidatus Rariloculus sp.]|uniref:putative Ig domain-containing protein n=1 Tax=Candidatus Rariloculus sp. TaxID=3101265 RepID=UPI003D0F20C5
MSEALPPNSERSRPPTSRFSAWIGQLRPRAAAATAARRLHGAVTLVRLACLTGLLAALGVPGAVLAQQTDDIDLVYNDDLSKIWELSIHEDYQSVQRFRTGPNPDGYVLSQVGLWLRRIDSGGTPVVTIHQQDRPGPPGPALWTLTNPTTFENDTRHMFSAPENTVLLPSQGYSVRVSAPDAPHASRFLLGKTLHVGSEGAEGWIIDATDLRYASTDGGNNWESGPGTHSMRITGRLIELDAATVTADAVQLTSSGPYSTGNVITAAVTFSEAVDVTGAPTLALLIGENSRRAAYVSGDGSSELVFSYTVVDADQDSNGVSVQLSALAVPTGASITKQGTDQSAVLNQLPRLDGDAAHKVNSGPVIAGRPTITSTPMASADTYGLAETVEITVTFDEPVTVDTVGGLPTFDIQLAGNDGTAMLYVRGSGTEHLVFAYVVQLGDRNTKGIIILANQLKLNSGTIRSPDGRDALLEHLPRQQSDRHKVNAQLTDAAAVLSELALSSVTLVPGFAATIFDYTASVGVDIGFTTVTATAPSGVTASIVPADADANTQGHQVMLDLGVTTITVTASKTGVPDFRYTVKVTRARANNTRPTASNSSATTNEDTPYTFKAADFNFSDADVGDELHSVVVVNLPGAGRLTLDGVAVIAREVVSEAQIGLLVFTPAADEFNESTTGTYYTRFEFRVSDGQDNSQNKYWFELHVDEVNDAPTGLPRIVGNARVGAELTANITHIEDADGLNNVSFIYQWIRVDGGTETTIADATAATYTLTDADEGMTIKVSVSFEDNNGHDATVTSDAWPANGTIGPVSEVCARTGAVRDAIVDAIPGVSNCDDVTSGQLAAITGTLLLNNKNITELAAGDFAGLTGVQILYLYSNDLTALPAEVFAGLTGLERLFLQNNGLSTLPAGVFAPLTKLDSLNLDSNELMTLPADLFSGLTNLVYLYLNNNGSHLRSLPAGLFDDLAALRYLHLHANRLPALPAELFDDLTALENLNLNGNRLRVQDLPDGIFERLTALTSLDLGAQKRGQQPIAPTAIAGPDNGRVSSAGGEVELDGSDSGGAWGTNVTYGWELTTAPTGVTVAFDDAAADSPRVTIPALPVDSVLTFTLTVSPRPSGAIGVEAGTDTATVTVITGPVTNIAPLASDSSVTTDEDTAYSFAASDFSFTDEDHGDELASVTVVTLPAVGALELDGVPVVVDQVVMAADISKLVFTPALNANGDAYASFTFKVNDGTVDSVDAFRMTVNVTPVNDPATGLPTIDGTVQAGEMLTAVTTGIADVDGLSGAIFSYRWIYVDISDVETDVGADSDTYRAVAANVGGKVKVEVSFTDDGLTTEELTSAAVGPVAPALDTTAPRVTSIERQDPTASLTNADTLTWRVTFSEDVANVDAMDFGVSGTTALLAVDAAPGSSSEYDVIASGGDLGSLNDTVTLSFASGQDIIDSATNVLSDTAPTETNDDYYVLDNTAPTVTITGVPATSSGPFTATFTFLEGVIGFAVDDIEVNNGAASGFTTTSDSIYMALITPASKGTVTVGVVEGAAQDPAGNGNTAATQVTSDYNTAPTGAPGTVTTNRDTDYTFDAADFGFSDADPGDTLDSVKITSLPASGKGALKLGGVEIAAANLPQTVDMNQLDAGSLTYSPPAGEIGDAFAVFQFKVNDGADDSASPDTMTIDVNGPPTLVSAGVPATGDRIVLTFSEDLARGISGPRTSQFTVTVAGNSSNFFLSSSADNEVILVVRSGVNPGESVVVTYTSPTTDASQAIQDLSGFDAASFTTGSDDVPEVQNNSANHRPTSSSSKVTTPRDTDYTFKVTDFNFMDDDAGDVLEKVKITSRPLPNRGEGTLMLDSTAIAQSRLPLTVSVAKLTDGDLTYSPPAGEGGADFATFRFKVNDGAVDSVSADTMTIDVGQNTALQVVSIERWDPSSSPTNSDTLTWRVTFSKDVANVDAADFGVTGTTALAASAVANVADAWDIIASGGDLASLNNTVTLSFAAGQNIQDTAGNVLSDTAPTGTNDDYYVVDNTAPTGTTYTAPDSAQVGDPIELMSPSVVAADIKGYEAAGLPPGLSIDATTGVISGTPETADINPASVTVTVSDTAGNTDTVNIEFPAVAKGTQTLTGFAYSPASVQFGDDAPTLTGPSGAQTTLSYSVSADSVNVCGVAATTGVLTLNGVGACAVTVTAAGTDNYNEASVTVTVTVQSTGNLVLNVGVIASDDTINIAEKAAGFDITGDTGTEAGVDVTVQIGTGTLTDTSADDAGTATWSVSVPGGAAYIAGTSVAVTVSASKSGFTAPPDEQRTVPVDLTAPTGTTYTAPDSAQVGDPIELMSPSVVAADIKGYEAAGLPLGLVIAATTGVISGTPETADINPASVTVTVSDTAGNTDTVNIEFPAVAKGTQTLTGFAYSPASVQFGDDAPTLTGPSGAQTTLSYSVSADSVNVCGVAATTGVLTLNGVGACAVTVTAAGTDNYNEASVTVTVTVQAAGVLVLNLAAIATDNTINIAEKAAGFDITGDTGTEAGVDVRVQIGTETLTDTSADDAGTATWSVSVPGGAAYIAGTSVAVTVSASKSGFTAPPDEQRTVPVDLTAPTGTTYTAPDSAQVGDPIELMSPSVVAADIKGYEAAGLPPGLSIDAGNGAISGTPETADINTASVTVTVSDTAGNTDTVNIEFPAVAKGAQTLTGFAYSPASVQFGDDAPTLTGPSGAQTTLSYSVSADSVNVCGVAATTGVLTLNGVGACAVTVTAEGTDNYNEASVTVTVTVQAAGVLVLNLAAIATDNTINIAEKAAGFDITGDTGTEAGVDVRVQIGTETLTDTSADDAGTATWSVSVLPDASYITGTSVAVTVSASKSGFTAPPDEQRTVPVDLTAPTGTTYTAPDSAQVGDPIELMSPSVVAADIKGYEAAGLPLGLVIAATTGVISGTPETADINTASVTVTVTDTADNTATVNIEFPAVDKGTQTLTGFAYNPASVQFGDDAPTLTGPSGAQTTLSYSVSADSVNVCGVAATTGVLTLNGVGACAVTVTAAGTDNYNEASVTVTVTVQAAGVLVLNLAAIATDNTINIAEKAAGFDITGDTGTEAGVDVRVQIGTETLTDTSADDAGTATWSVSVLPDASYITGTSVAVTVSASKSGFTAPPDEQRTVPVDLTAPTGTTYTAPDSAQVGDPIELMSPSVVAADIKGYEAAGLPPGLVIAATTGVISGTPETADINTASVTVTVTDTADNTATVDIEFPAVAKGAQTLTGFAYNPASVQFGDDAPTLTGPSGAQTTLSYSVSADSVNVCGVAATTGVLTLNGVGACAVTVTAEGTDNYNEASVTVTVTVQAAGVLVLNLAAIATDNTINIAEKTAGFDITGDTGTEAGVDVRVQIGTETLTDTSADDAGTATWSVSVLPDASYITGTSVAVTVSAAKSGFTAPPDEQRTVPVDLTAPTGTTYTAPDSAQVGDPIELMSPSVVAADIKGYEAAGLPPGLSIDATTGVISGTPETADINTASVTVTVSDTAGNTDTVNIEFPAVAKGTQTLTGFAYSPASVQFGDDAPTLTGPSGAQTTLSYSVSADSVNVCGVAATTGVLTLNGVGACAVTVTAAGTDNYNEASVTVTVTVQSTGNLVLNVGVIASDDTINIAEKAAGFDITGDTGTEAGVDVTVQIGTGTLTDTSADDAGTATWSVSVPGGAAYIAGTSVAVTVSASKSGFTAPPDEQRTVPVDLTAPTGTTYTAPDSAQVGDPIELMSPSVVAADIKGYEAAGLPPGLSIDATTGVISGTPETADINPASVTVTVSDTAGNTDTVNIEFPAVAKGTQTLTGFAYSPASVQFGDDAPTLTGPSGAQTTLSYSVSADSVNVCGVAATTGVLTLNGVGACAVTVTAAGTDNYNEASVTVTVTVQSTGNLVLNVGVIATDNTINIAEKAAGFDITGDTGTEAGVDVTVQIGTGTLTDTSADDAGTATWSVSVPGGAAYIAGTSVAVTVSASKSGFTAPPDEQRTVPVDLTAPTGTTYTAPDSAQVGDPIELMSPSVVAADIKGYEAAGLPPGLVIAATTGVISGTPETADINPASVTVTVSDTAGNTDTVNIEFPAVAKGTQTLTGFAYSPASVQFGDDAPTLTGPSGAQTTLSYSVSADSVNVCGVAATTGVLTLNGVGACAVTVTAAGTDNYNEASVTVTVTVQSTGNLVLNVGVIATDNTINIAEKAAGFDITGDTGTEAGVDVTVQIGTGTLTDTSADDAGTATWSVSVLPDASYITGTSVAVTVSASKSGFTAPPDEQRTVPVDLTAPTGTTYTAPDSAQVGDPIELMSPSVVAADIKGYEAAGLPPGLSIDATTGVISGTPETADINPASVTVTVSDTAGNTDTVNIEFPAVAKGTQTLTGFAYSPASVQFGDDAPTLTGPSGAQTTLSYSVSADSVNVCGVAATTGVLTLNGVGACAVTVTAAGTDNYNEASVTVTVTVQSTGNLVLNVGVIASDDTINIAEKAAGFDITGDTGTEAGVDVTVQIGTGTLTDTSADDAGTATWSVSVPGGAAYIAGTSVAVTVSASKSGFTAPPDEQRTVPVDLTAPTGTTYTAPDSAQVGDPIELMSPSVVAADIKGYEAAGLPLGLVIAATTGVISGTPETADINPASVTVTVSDTAGNTDTVNIEFPAVAKGTQTLTGFAYSPASVQFGDDAPTLTGPSGAQTTLSYSVSADSVNVCGVAATTGVLTLNGVGACAVTVTAAGTDNYNEASVTVTVTVQSTGNLVLNVGVIATDNTINIAEKAAGFDITGDTGTEAGVDVRVQIGTETLTDTSADDAGTATWSVSVLPDASYITGTSVAVTVSASKSGFTAPPDEQRTVPVDLTAPTGTTYTAPDSAQVGDPIELMSPSVVAADIKGYEAAGLPPGLSIDATTGVISGTPETADINTASVTVTVSDTAGNTDTVNIEFPAVAKGTQTLTGFAYSPASVQFGDDAPTLTGPSGAQTTLSYSVSADSVNVCGVAATTGVLTLNGVGACAVTVTAAGTDNYNEASVTVTVTVQDADGRSASTAVTLTVDPATVKEGSGGTTLRVTGSLNGAARTSETTVTLSVGASEDSAVAGTDYAAVGDLTLIIATGQTSGTETFTLTPANDGVVEGDETLTVSGTAADGDLTVTGTGVTIVDANERGVTISPAELTVSEGDSAEYTVVLTSKPTGTVRVTISGTTGTDLRRSRTVLSFRTSNWNEPQTVTVTARQDEDAEDDTVTISHAVSGADYEANGVTADAVSVTIDDDDRVSTGVDLSVSHTSFDEDASFTGVVVTGTLNGIARAEPTTLTLSVGASEDAATEGTDYVAVDDLGLTIPAGQASATAIFVFKPTDDLIDEPAEAVSITGATGIADFEVTGTTLVIKDNDERGVTVSPTDLALTEGGSATYTVVLDTEPTETVTVTPSVSGRADVIVSAALTFTATDWGEAQTVTVTAAQDANAGNDKATIGHAVAGGDYGANSATADDVSVTVDDDETAVLLTVNPTAVDEGGSGTGVTVTGTLDGVTRNEPTTVTVSVGASDDAAIAGTDYVAVDDLSLTIPSGEASGTASFTFTPLEDRIDERVEAVSITGTTEAAGFAVTGTTLSIEDNDERGVRIGPSALTVPEGGNDTYTVVLTSEPTGDVTVTPSVNGSPGVTVSVALTFTPSNWDEAQTVTVAAAQDADAANDKATVGHAVSGADYGTNIVTADDVSVTVEDDETAVTLTVNPAAVDEDDGDATVTVTGTLDGVTRDEPTTLTVIVGAADDAAIGDTDYVAVDNLSLTIPSGEASGTATFTLTTMDDLIDEPDEAVSITGTSQDAGFEVIGTAVSITDNDERGVQIDPTALTVPEGGDETYTVVLTSEPIGDVTVTPSVNGDADVTVSSALRFTATDWDQAQTVTVSAAQDADAANDTATIEHTVSGADYGANGVTANDVPVTVEDVETVVTLTANPAAVKEGAGAAIVTVTGRLDGEPRAEPTTLTVSVGGTGDAATGGTDYAAVNDLSLTIPSGQASGTATFTLTPLEDLIDEPDEAVSITGSAEVAGFDVTGTTLVIADNDERGVTVSPAELVVAEGASATYTVVLDTEPTESVTVTPSVSGSPDLTFEPSSLTFTASDWDTAQTVTISATEDDDAYHDSSLVLHAAAGADYNSLIGGEVAVTIADNEVASEDTLPAQVTNLTATGTATHVDLSWDAVEETVLGYRMEASYDGGADWAEVEDNTERTESAYRHNVGLRFSETRLYRVSAVGENGAGLPSVFQHAGATATTGGLTATVVSPENTTDPMLDGVAEPMSENATDSMLESIADRVRAIDLCWVPQGVVASELSDVAMSMIPDYSSGATDLGDIPWQSIGSGSSEVDCEGGVGVRVTSITDNQRYAFRMRASHAGVWLVSNDAQAVLADASKPLRTVVTAGASGLSGDTPVPELLCGNYDDPATREEDEGSFFLSIGFTTAGEEFVRYEPVNGFDPASDLTLVNATAELVYRRYDTQLGYRVRITPTVWGEPVAVSVPADVVTHAETSVGNQASGEFRLETTDAEDCDSSTAEPVRRSQVTAVGIEEDGDRNGEWTALEPIRVTIRFDEALRVDTTEGVPGVALTLGAAATTEQSPDEEAATEVTASFSHVAHEDMLVFEHLVTEDESPIGDITLPADSLSLNGGRIDSFSGPAVDLAHPEATVVGGQIVQPDLTAGWSTVPGAHKGSENPFEMQLRFSEDVDFIEVIGEQNLIEHAFTVSGGAVESIGPSRDRQGEYVAYEWTLRVVPDSDEPVTISPVVGLECDEPGAVCTIDDRPLSEATAVTVHRIEQLLSVAEAEVGEGPGAVLVFEVTLTRAAAQTVTVDYETADGTATAGEDYEAVSGTLSIEAGEAVASVQVSILDDSHDEGEETLTLILSNASNARIANGEALGVIVNSDPIPGAWLARFGRAASDHVAQAVSRRLQREPSEEHLRVGGVRLDRLFTSFADPDAGRAAGAHIALEPRTSGDRQSRGSWAATGSGNEYAHATGSGLGTGSYSSMPTGVSGVQGLAGDMTARNGRGSRASNTLPSLRDALMGSSFFHTFGGDEDTYSSALTAWGETATTRFSGSEGALSLDGEVSTAMLGLDKRYGRWLVGSTLSYSEGEGGYRRTDALGGSVHSTLRSLNPYAHFELNDTTSLWGVIGYGEGRLQLTPQGAQFAIETDLSNRMAAFGGRGVLSVRTGGAGRFELALRSDALLTSTDSEAVQGLAGAQSATSRVRLLLEGSGSLSVWGGTLRPTVEAGLRYDGGDAETGAGFEIGGGLAYAGRRWVAQVNARGLVAHEDTAYEEWGFSGSVQYQPGKDGRGLSMNLGSAWGATHSGVQSLWTAQDASGLARGAAMNAAQRFQAELGYGLAGRGKAEALWVPFLGAESADGGAQSLRMGVKLTSGPNVEMGLEFGRRDSERGVSEYAMQLKGAVRF